MTPGFLIRPGAIAMVPDKPLFWPPPVPREQLSDFDRILELVPIIRGISQMERTQRRLRPIVDHIEHQLLARRRTPVQEWTSHPSVIESAEFLRRAIQKDLGWPNDQFVPDDPMDILCWPHQDALDDIDLVFSVDSFIGRPLTPDEIKQISGMTFREASVFLASLKSESGLSQRGRSH